MNYSRLVSNISAGEDPESFPCTEDAAKWTCHQLLCHPPEAFSHIYCLFHQHWESLAFVSDLIFNPIHDTLIDWSRGQGVPHEFVDFSTPCGQNVVRLTYSPPTLSFIRISPRITQLKILKRSDV